MLDTATYLIKSLCPLCGQGTKSNGVDTWCRGRHCEWREGRQALQLERKFVSYEEKTLGPHKFGCLMAILPEAVRKQITDWSIENIPDFHLGEGGREERPHATVKYGFKNSDPDTVAGLRSLLARWGPLELTLGDFFLFKGNEDGDVLNIAVDCPKLHELNAEVTASFPCEDKYPDYVPHVCIAYLDSAVSEKYEAEPSPFLNWRVRIDSLEWSGADETRDTLSLSIFNGKDLSAFNESSGGAMVEPAEQDKGIGDSIEAVGRWLAGKWARLEERYGRRAALTMALAMAGTSFLPGNMLAIVAVAEGVRGIGSQWRKDLDDEWEGGRLGKAIAPPSVKRFLAYRTKGEGEPCEQGETAARSGCVPKTGSASTSQPRARSGGEEGPNGEWYPGGAFIATTDMPKRVKDKIKKLATGKVQVEPSSWEIPEPGRMSILDKFGGSILNHRDGSINYEYLEYAKYTKEQVSRVEEIVEKWRQGERWIDVNDYPELASFKDLARMIVAGIGIPGAALDEMPEDIRNHLQRYSLGKQPKAGQEIGKIPEPPRVKALPLYHVKEGGGYFATCERDEGGQCLPSGQAGAAPKEKPGKAPKQAKPESKPSAKKPEAEVKIKATKQRAWNGKPVPVKEKISKQDAGKIGEAVVIAWLKSEGMKDARHLNLDRNNFPIDLVQDHESIEVKTGMVSNAPDAMKWRLTIGEPGKEEKAWLAKASAEDKAAWNAKKQQMIHERKKKALADLSKKLGKKVRASTITCLLNPDTKTVDIFRFKGWHNRIAWRSEEAKAAYVGSVTYE